MNQSQFNNLVKGKEPFNEFTLKEITGCIEQYEWCNILHQLYLKNVSLLKKESFEQTTFKESCYAIDRKKLHQYIFGVQVKVKSKVSEEIIDNFILNTPSIRKPKENAPNIDIAEHSVREHEDLVSETLANIYLKQGNFQKAIQIFEKLSLIIPEKSSYFAAQIDKINKQDFSK